MIIYLDENYPLELVEMLTKLHSLSTERKYEVVYRQNFEKVKQKKPCVFLFDQSIKGLDLTTLEYFNDGMQVFVFKLHPKSKNDPFKFCLAILSLWPKFLSYVQNKQSPFVCSFTSTGRHSFAKVG